MRTSAFSRPRASRMASISKRIFATPRMAPTDLAWWLGCVLVALAAGTLLLARGGRRRRPQEVLRDIR